MLPNLLVSRWRKPKSWTLPKLLACLLSSRQIKLSFKLVVRNNPRLNLSLRLFSILKSTNNQLSLLLPSNKHLFSWHKNSLNNCWPRLPRRRPSKPRHSNNNTCKLKLTRPKHRCQFSSSKWPSKIPTRSMHKQILNLSNRCSSHSYTRKRLLTMSRFSSLCISRSCSNSSMRNRCSPISSNTLRPRRCSRRYHNRI